MAFIVFHVKNYQEPLLPPILGHFPSGEESFGFNALITKMSGLHQEQMS
jgi:hypothetical protein